MLVHFGYLTISFGSEKDTSLQLNGLMERWSTRIVAFESEWRLTSAINSIGCRELGCSERFCADAATRCPKSQAYGDANLRIDTSHPLSTGNPWTTHRGILLLKREISLRFIQFLR